MSHDHHHHHDTENIKLAFFLNLVFTIIEFIGGFMTNSLSILSDALHDLGDSLSLGLAWYFQNISERKRDEKFTYGYKRFSLIGALINSIILIVGSIFILKAAIPRIMNPQITNAQGMMMLAILGIIINGVAVLRMRSSHGHNAKLVSLHLFEDVLGWAAVLIGSIVIYYTGWYQIDAILCIGISMFILFNVYKHLRSTFKIILQGTPKNINLDQLKMVVSEIPLVHSIHDLHVWSLDGEKNIMTAHVVLSEELNYEKIKSIKKQIGEKVHEMNIEHHTLEFELIGECPDDHCHLDEH